MMRKIQRFGLNYGIGGIIWTFLMWGIGAHDIDAGKAMPWIESSYQLICVVWIVLAMRAVKKANKGFISVGKGFRTGAGVILIGQTIYSLFGFVYRNIINPDFILSKIAQMERSLEGKEDQLAAAGINVEEYIQKAIDVIESPMSIVWEMVSTILVLLIVTLIVAAIIQNKKTYKNEFRKDDFEVELDDDELDIDDDEYYDDSDSYDDSSDD